VRYGKRGPRIEHVSPDIEQVFYLGGTNVWFGQWGNHNVDMRVKRGDREYKDGICAAATLMVVV
jgi:hypothetical protein